MNRWIPLFAGVFFGLAALGCGDDDPDPGETPDAGADSAQIRVVHASPDAPAVDIYAAGVATPLVEDLEYGETTPYLPITAGTYDLQIRPAGAAADSDPVFSTGPVTVPAGARVTAIAAGLLQGTGDEAFRVLFLAEEFQAAAAERAIIRVVHASPDAPTVAIDLGNDGQPEVPALNRFESTGAEGIAVPAGQPAQVGILAGDPLAPVTSFTTPGLPAGSEVFVIATGRLTDRLPRQPDGFTLLAVNEAGTVGFIEQNPVVYALHGSPDAPPVDIYLGETQLVGGLAFGELSAPIQVPPGSYQLDFYAAGAGPTDAAGGDGVMQRPGTPAASATTPELEAGERYLAIATGFLAANGGEQEFQLVVVVDDFALDNGESALVRVVHASPDAPAVDVSTVDGGELSTPVLVDDLAFAQATEDALEVPAADLEIGVAAAGTTDPVATFDVTTTPGLRAFAVAVGALTPTDGQASFRLILVVTSVWPWVASEVMPNGTGG